MRSAFGGYHRAFDQLAEWAFWTQRSIFVVAFPPLVRRSLWPSRRRILPVFLPSVGCQIEERPDAAERFDAASGREVAAINAIAIPKKNAKSEGFSLISGKPEIDVEITASGRKPRYGP